jgi:hypothetical protein
LVKAWLATDSVSTWAVMCTSLKNVHLTGALWGFRN